MPLPLPFPKPPPRHSYVRQTLAGGEYISTGYFRDEDVNSRGKGRTSSNCKGVATLMFDVDIVTILTETRRSLGQEVEDTAKGQKAFMYRTPPAVIDRWKGWIRDEIIPTIETAIGQPATCLVDTGWGYHAHFRVGGDVCNDIPYLSRVAELAIANANEQCITIGKQLAMPKPMAHLSPWDATHDVGARLCRIPGTMNTKCKTQHKECTVVGGDRQSILSRADCGRIVARLAPADLFNEPPQRKQPQRHKTAELDFRRQSLADGRTWQGVVDSLGPGERLNVICVYGGTSVGSAFIAKDKDGRRSRYYSNAEKTTYWNTYQPTPRKNSRADLVPDPRNVDQPEKSRSNLELMLEQDSAFDLWYNSFTHQIMNGDKALDEGFATGVILHMERQYNWRWRIGKGEVWDMVEWVAQKHARNPLVEYLESIKWDGQSRCDRLFIEGCGVDDSNLHRAYGLRFLIGMVARALHPGCKQDCVPVLTGKQGWGKSTFFRMLVDIPGLPGLFCDTKFDVSNKDAYLTLYRCWLYEDAEGVAMGRAASDKLKNFLSSAEDTFRKPYHRGTVTLKRHTCIVSTTNRRGFLNDPTGSRRYWGMEVGGTTRKQDRLDRAWLAANRDQLFAEAVHHFRAGVQWWLTPHEELLRSVANGGYESLDWFSECAQDVYLSNSGGPPAGFTMGQFAKAIPLTDRPACPQRDGKKLKDALLRAGFVQHKRTNRYRRWYYRQSIQSDEHSDGLDALKDKDVPTGGTLQLAR